LNLICIGSVAHIIKPSTVAITLLKTRDELNVLLELIRSWRLKGINGSGVVPIAILPLEAKLEKSIKDIEAMIKIAANV
jgi:hypothetical protein